MTFARYHDLIYHILIYLLFSDSQQERT